MTPKREANAVVDATPEDAATEPLGPPSKPAEKEIYVFPASQEQSRYWILDQLDGASTASNMAIAFRLQGQAHDQLIERALTALTLRHEALRTTYRMVEGELSQVISEEADYHFKVSDLRSLAESERSMQAEELIAEHGRVQIDLAHGPVLYVRLIHLTETAHFLAFTIHHIACDGWSNGVLVRDFSELYAALSEGRTPALPELPFQFADFTVWQQEWLESDAAKAALAFWKEHIRRDMPAVDLPTDRPRSAQNSGPGQIESVLLSPALNTKSKAYCRQNNATMHQVLLAAFEGLLSRYTHQSEFLLGSTIANRTQPGMENVVGRFAHPQVLLADVRGNPSYRELLRRVSEWSTLAYSHQDLPFSRLMEEFQMDQVGATSQFLQVYFVYQKAFMQPQEKGPLKIIPRPSVSGGVNFDMLVSIVDRAEGPRLQIEYNTLLFTQRRVQRLVEMYARLLEAVMENDSLAVSDLPLLSSDEERAVVTAGSAPRSAAETAGSIPEWFDHTAEVQLEADAVVSGGSRLSWRELLYKSRNYAVALSKLGVHTGSNVALRMEARPNTAAAAVALLRLGAIVLPIPAGTMQTEMDLVQRELKPEMILTDEPDARGKDASTGNVVSLSHLEFLGSAALSVEALPYPEPQQTAWLGIRVEDGHLKTVAATHASTLAAMTATAQALNLRRGDAVLVFPAPSSTDSWTDLLVPILAGATIIHASQLDGVDAGKKLDVLVGSLVGARAGSPGGSLVGPPAGSLGGERTCFAFATAPEWLALLHGGWSGNAYLRRISRGTHLSPAAARRLSAASGAAWLLVASPFVPGPFSVAPLNLSEEGASRLAPPPPLLPAGSPAGTTVNGSRPVATGSVATTWGATSLATTNLTATNLTATNLTATNLTATNLSATNLSGTNPGATALVGAVAPAEIASALKLVVSDEFSGPLLPLPGESFLLRDEAGHPVPAGVHGELAVQRKSAIYPTGWIATYTPEAGYKLVDAAQRVVKLHSYRLRLSEVEDLLAEHPQVASAAATLVQKEDGSSALVAYVSAYPVTQGRQGTALPLHDVAAFLKSRAPAHLAATELLPVQGHIRRIDGSIDASFQRRLDPGQVAPQSDAADYVAPRDELEEKLVAIWEASLGVKGIGIRTSFFSLGGYSLMIVRLFARINKTMGTSLPITTIFNAPTIEQLADVLRGRTIYSSLVPIHTKGTRAPFFLVHSYLLYEGLRTALGDDQPFYGLRELDRDQAMSLDMRVSSYVNEIRRIQPHGPYYIGGWCAAGPLAVSTARQLTDAGEKVDLLVLFDSWRPGYAAELASGQSANPEMNLRARFRRKWLFHQRRLAHMRLGQKLSYFGAAILHKLRSMRDHYYIRNWGLAQQLFTRFNLPLPDFMHNVSLTTMHAVKLYRGLPFPGRMTLIRATEAHYIPGAEDSCGWSSLAQGGVRVLWAPGDHESMFVEPNLSVVGELLRGMLSNPHMNEGSDV